MVVLILTLIVLSLIVKQLLIVLMTAHLKSQEDFTASMRGKSVGLQDLAPVRVALGLKVFTARLLLSV